MQDLVSHIAKKDLQIGCAPFGVYPRAEGGRMQPPSGFNCRGPRRSILRAPS